MGELVDRLRALVKGEVLNDNQALFRYSRDASLFEVRPRAVVVPADVEDLKRLVKFAVAENPGTVSLTVRSGGTDMTGGTLSESLVVDIKRLNRMVSVGQRQAITQPAVYYRDFEKATLAKGLLLPSYPASRQMCTVGGMVANNAGGEKSLVYGQTVRYVHSLKVVLADGNEYIIGPMTRQEAEQRAQSDTFEGRIYRDVLALVTEHQDVIRNSQPNVSKNSAGYRLAEVWDGTTFNLAKLFTGSQGTLGIVTQITFDLVTPKLHTGMLVAFLDDAKSLSDLTTRLAPFKPESVEMYDDKTFSLAVRFFPEFLKLVGARSTFSLALRFIPEVWMALTGGIPKIVVLAEFTDMDEPRARVQAERAAEAIRPLVTKVRVIRDEDEAKKYWAMRRESFNLLRRHLRKLQTAPFIDDLIVPAARLGEFFTKLEAILAPSKMSYSLAGHIGDGNLHVISLVDLNDEQVRRQIPKVTEQVYNLVLAMGGSITAEHNDGLIRTPFLEKMYGKEMYELFRRVKDAFDPHRIFNPGKKVDGDWEYAIAHIKRDTEAFQW